MAFRFAPQELRSNLNRGCQFSGLIRWETTGTPRWVIVTQSPRFSVSGVAGAPVITIPGVEGSFAGALVSYNGLAAIVANRCNTVITGADAVLTITLSANATAVTDFVAFQAAWDESPVQ